MAVAINAVMRIMYLPIVVGLVGCLVGESSSELLEFPAGNPDGREIQNKLDAARRSWNQTRKPQTIDLTAGRTYDIRPVSERWHRFMLEGVTDLTIDGHGAVLQFHDQTLAFQLEGCTNVTFKNLTIINRPVPFTQGTVVRKSPHPDHSWFDVVIDDDFRPPPLYSSITNKWQINPTKPPNAIIFAGNGVSTRLSAAHAHFEPRAIDRSTHPDDIGRRVFRIDLGLRSKCEGPPGSAGCGKDVLPHRFAEALDGIELADRFAIALGFTAPQCDHQITLPLQCGRADLPECPPCQRERSGDLPSGNIVVARSTNVRFENVRMLSSPDKAFRLHDNDGAITFDGLFIQPSAPNLIAIVRDGIHAKNNRKGPTILRSRFEGILDDNINITSLPYRVTRIAAGGGKQFRLVGMDDAYAYRIKPTERLMFVAPRVGRVVKESTEVVTSELKDDGAYDVTVSDAIENLEGLVAYNVSAANDAFEISGTKMYPLVNRAISATGGGNSLIARNLVEGRGGAGIWLANWRQVGAGPWARGTDIIDNVVRDAKKSPGIKLGVDWGGPDQLLDPKKPEVAATLQQVALNVLLKGNCIRRYKSHAIEMTNASEVTLESNIVATSPETLAEDLPVHDPNSSYVEHPETATIVVPGTRCRPDAL